MLAKLAADLLVLLHFAFIVFVLMGGLLILRWPRVLWLHLPALVWGVLIEFIGFICPLTPVEQQLRYSGGEEAYSGGFIERYITPMIYPDGLERSTQIVLGVLVIVVNIVVYAVAIILRKRRSAE